jgi:hypothetical protein
MENSIVGTIILPLWVLCSVGIAIRIKDQPMQKAAYWGDVIGGGGLFAAVIAGAIAGLVD